MTLNKQASQALKFLLISGFILVVCIFSLELHDARKQINVEIDKYNELDAEYNLAVDKHQEELEVVNNELNTANATIADLKSDEYELVYIGDYKLTHYCDERYKHICGWGIGLTASGANTEVGRTIAVDPNIIPYGTQVYIEGYGWRVAEDCGGAVKNNHIDILVNTHDEALSLGTKTGGVWMLVHKTIQN